MTSRPVVPSASKSLLTITVEGLKNNGRQLPPTIGGVANEGAVPLGVKGRIGGPRAERQE